MGTNFKKKASSIFLIFIYLPAFCLFYLNYTPSIHSFHLAFLPILFLLIVLTAMHLEGGILFFVFSFPLISNFPYLFGVDETLPHAPTALVLFLAFFLGWLLHRSLSGSLLNFNIPLSRPLIMLSTIIVISCLITFFRHTNFYPILSDGIHELVVNIIGVRAGGAIMSTIFFSLNYLTGFFFFFILVSSIKSKSSLRKILVVLAFSTLISLVFALIQKYHSAHLGNTPYWANSNQINSTFKDPNSFGIYLSAFLPLSLGTVFFFLKSKRWLVLLLILLSLFIFPSISPRSGFLGLIVSIFLFALLFLTSSRISLRKRIVLMTSIFLIILLVSLCTIVFFKQSSLYQRLDWSLNMLGNENFLKELFTGKLKLWIASRHMIMDYPLTGVGLGSFIIELPNYLKLLGFPYKATDSAENYFLQIGSEMGLIGLLLYFWIVYEIIKHMRKRLKSLALKYPKVSQVVEEDSIPYSP